MVATMTETHDVRFGHTERGADLAVQQRLQPLLLLLWRAEHVQNLHKALDRSANMQVILFSSENALRTRSTGSTSMLPVSGADELNTSGARKDRPSTSQIAAYSRFVSPRPCLAHSQKEREREQDRDEEAQKRIK
jgi:hypothetical protein